MTMLNIEDSLVLIIDVQEKLLNTAFNKEQLEKNAKIMASSARILEIPTIVTEQYPKGLGSTVERVKSELMESTKFFEKVSFSALDTEEILNTIKSYDKKQIVIFGIETHICVNQTASALTELGYEVYLIKDASGSRKLEEHLAGIERMRENGVHPITTEIALFEWLKTAKHPKFKEVQGLIKV